MVLNKSLRHYTGVFALSLSPCICAQPVFDAHLHYSAADARLFTPQDIIHQLDTNAITNAVVTGSPSVHVSKLYHLAPERIVPLLSVYRQSEDKSTWTSDETLVATLEAELERGYWGGIGELHVFADDRHSPVFNNIIALASKWQLPLLIHCDPAVIDTIFEIAPNQPVIWAHAGTFPYPDLVSDYLRRYPKLSIDVSMRDERIAPDGTIDDDWYELFVTYPDRVMVGVDTYSTARWHALKPATETIRNWLAQLPEKIARQLAFNNAERHYKIRRSISRDEEGAKDVSY